MPRKCCVPGCRSNYTGESEIVPVFSFPSDPERRRVWLKEIPRADYEPTKQSVVCSKHFSDRYIRKTEQTTKPDGTIKRRHTYLTKDAYPSIFPNCPSYLSSEPPKKRKAPEERQLEAIVRDENAYKDWMHADRITDYVLFCSSFKDRIGTKWLHKSNKETGYTSFYHVEDEDESGISPPKLISTIRVFMDMHVQIFNSTGVPFPANKLMWILGKSPQPTLSLWSQFDTLLSHFSSSHDITQQDIYNHHVDCLQQLCNDDTDDTDNDGDSKVMTTFLLEQLKLEPLQQKRYSSQTILWAFRIFAASPSTYTLLRNNLLTLPSVSYLRKLSSVFNIKSGVDKENSHELYLREKCQNLKEHEKMVILMLDEIHVSDRLSYKGGKLEGSAHNCQNSGSSTAQVFMISSYLCKNKDVVAIVPVKNLTASVLYDMLIKTLEILFNAGYYVLCVISDNNRINRNAFTMLCGGHLTTSIQNPFDIERKLFILFDTVHLFKSIRNNWLSQKDAELTLMYPAFAAEGTMKASFSHLRKLYSAEKQSTIRMAPALSGKALFPSTTERQNVNLMLKIFDEKNVVALEHYGNVWSLDTEGTREFLRLIKKLWNVINVNTPGKHIRLRNEDCKPITSMTDNSASFLLQMIRWIEVWQSSPCVKPREGGLSNETMFALLHTMKGLYELCSCMLGESEIQVKYILLGKFQTDNLEFRFSLYRQLSGTNYHISIQQLLESGKKLKLISVLKLVSASKGLLSLKDITETLEDKVTCDSLSIETEYLEFIDLLPQCENVDVSPEQLKSLVFISGYAASRQMRKTACEECRGDLVVSGKNLSVEVVGDDSFTYLSALNRGGLTWPSQEVVNTVTNVFTIFQTIIGTKSSEESFLKCSNQRSILLNLSMKRMVQNESDFHIHNRKCNLCDKKTIDLLFQCCKPAINILLNNYSKLFSEKHGKNASNKRKLKTFTS